MISFDSNLLTAFYQSRLPAAANAALGGSSSSGASVRYAPTAPWSPQATPADTAALMKAALQGGRFIDENAAKLDLSGASSDYRKLFALYQGLGTLTALAERMNGSKLSSFEASRITSAFARGMTELSTYVEAAKFDKIRLGFAEVSERARSTVGVSRGKYEYVTAPLVTGAADTPVPAFDGDVRFNINIKQVNSNVSVAIDLSDMGAQPRTLANVINHINAQLQSAGVTTRFAQERIPGEERSLQSGGRTIKLPAGPDRWAMKIKTDITETVSFAAVETAPAIYLAQKAGNPDPDGKPDTKDSREVNQLLKFHADGAAVPAPLQQSGEANWVEGRAFVQTMAGGVETVRATQVGPDGSVYVLADVTRAAGDTSIKGERDVALLKYDSAGKLMYSRVLGAAENASGLALAVSADGKVAIAGSVTGGLGGSVDGPLNSGSSAAMAGKKDSFVTVFSASGEEMWTARRGSREDDEATHIAFGDDGAVYVTGRSRTSMPGTTALGGWDSYVQGFGVDAKGVPQSLFTQSFGTAGDDKPAGLVVDGTTVYAASVEDGRAIVRSFDISGGAPVETGYRDLGSLQGGSIAGLALNGGNLVIAGATTNDALMGGAVTRAHSGGTDAFAAQFSKTLSATGSDAVAYYGGAGDDQVAGLAVSGGQVWLTGSVGSDLPGHDTMGTADGFLTRLDIAAGDVAWSQRFTGRDGYATPGAIAVAAQGASVLDRLGLPSGELTFRDTGKLTALSTLRPGDNFQIAVNGGRPKTITITGDETLESLMLKIRRETGFQLKVDTAVADGVRYLQISPLNARTIVELSPGKTGQDALKVLGLKEGVVRGTVIKDGKTTSADGQGDFYGLGMHSAINLSSPEQIRHAMAELTAAQGVIRKIYTALRDAATPASVLAQRNALASAGKAPAYLTNQIANYQAALDRLTGGG